MFYVYLFIAALAVIVFVLRESRPAKCYGCGLPADNGTAWCISCRTQRDAEREEADRRGREALDVMFRQYEQMLQQYEQQGYTCSLSDYKEHYQVAESVARDVPGERVHWDAYPNWSN